MDQVNPDVTIFAKTNFRNREVPFGIRRDDRRRHMYIIGKTGMGKTTLIENMVIQDILNGHGVAFVDPHGDSVEKVLNYIPASRVNDIIYFNPADVDFPIAFNPLEAVDPKHKHLVASGLMGVFTKIWAGVWSPRMEYILQNTILALLDSPGNTMLGVARMYVDKTYRKKIVDNIKDPVVRSFWVDEFANYQDKFRTEAVAPIQNKVGQFLSNAIIRNIVGQTKSSIDLRDIMDNRKILLLNLSKGRIGEDSSALLGAMIITKLQLAAMSRVDIPEEERADFYLYVDEFQNFATESFANILSEARKYRLNLIVAHQYIGQLVQDKNTVVRDAIFGNVGTMITFRVGADDAEFLEKEFEPTYMMNDLVNLSKWSIYLKLMINGVASNPFSASTLPPIAEPTDNSEKVIKVSRERYANDRMTIEQKISKWLGAEFHTEVAKVESESVNEEGVSEELRFKHPENAISAPVPAKPAAPPRAASPTSAPSSPRPHSSAPRPPQSASTPASAPARQAQTAPKPPAPPAQPQPPTPSVTASNEPPLKPKPAANPPLPQPQAKAAASAQAVRPNRPTTPPLSAPTTTPLPPVVPLPVPNKRDLAKQQALDDEFGFPDEPTRPFSPPSINIPSAHSNTPASSGQKDGPQPSPKPQKAKHVNPIWDTVTELTTQKVKESVNKTNQALDTLSKGLQESVVKHPPKVPSPPPAAVRPEVVTPPKFEPRTPVPETKAAFHNPLITPQPEKAKPGSEPLPKIEEALKENIDFGHLSDPKLPEDHIHPENQTLSPHHNIQHVISNHGTLTPGQTVKFD